VVVGGGFGGLYTVRKLRKAPVNITLVDRRNFHLFQPLPYQVSNGGLSPADIASPLRHVFKRQRNARVVLGEAVAVDPVGRRLLLADGELAYDTLVIATGVRSDYFGHDGWEPLAPGLKSIEDAVEIRRRVLAAFEAAEREPDPARRRAWLTFVVVGGGPTGVELAGALGELAHHSMRGEFRSIDLRESRVILVEGSERVLPSFPPALSHRAQRSLARLAVEARTGTRVVGIDPEGVDLQAGGRAERLSARTVLWAAGIAGTSLGRVLHEATDCELDPIGRVIVEPDLTVPGYPELFVIGDLAHVKFRGVPLPGIAPAAIQEGKYVARVIHAARSGHANPAPFRYLDKGALATIGRFAAVAEFHGLRFWGIPAWLVWLAIHITYLIGFENRVLVLIQWTNMYFRRGRGARLITHGPPVPVDREHAAQQPPYTAPAP